MSPRCHRHHPRVDPSCKTCLSGLVRGCLTHGSKPVGWCAACADANGTVFIPRPTAAPSSSSPEGEAYVEPPRSEDELWLDDFLSDAPPRYEDWARRTHTAFHWRTWVTTCELDELAALPIGPIGFNAAMSERTRVTAAKLAEVEAVADRRRRALAESRKKRWSPEARAKYSATRRRMKEENEDDS